MTTKLDHILGKIIMLTKNIYLQEPSNGSGYISKFFAGKPDLMSPFGMSGFGLEWWFTKEAFSCCEDIANMALNIDPVFEGGEQSSFSKRIQSVLQEIVMDRTFFDVDQIFYRKARTLFDARVDKDEKSFAVKVWCKLKENFINSMTTWIVIYPLHRINSSSVSLGFEGLSLLAANDNNYWESLTANFKNAKGWNPLTGKLNDKESFFNFQAIKTWLVCAAKGTEMSVRRLARNRMSTFIAVLFSHLYKKVPNLLQKSMAQECTYSIQFSKDNSSVGIGSSFASIGEILPPLLIDIDISQDDIDEINKWYEISQSLAEKKKRRLITASHFVHHAIIQENIDRFIHFFISLDAMYGERDKNEESIINGILNTFPDWGIRAKKIYDLRCNLIHGGCSSLEDWDGLEYYRRTFQSNPLKDVGIAAMEGLASLSCR